MANKLSIVAGMDQDKVKSLRLHPVQPEVNKRHEVLVGYVK